MEQRSTCIAQAFVTLITLSHIWLKSEVWPEDHWLGDQPVVSTSEVMNVYDDTDNQ